MNIISIVKKITDLGERQQKNIFVAEKIIADLLKTEEIKFSRKQYKVQILNWKNGSLIADGVEIKCMPTSFNSGKIVGNYAVVSSLVSSKYFIDTPHINFNPKSKSLSRANFSFAPSVAISKKDLGKIFKAKEVIGEVLVEKSNAMMPQIIVGNKRNPKNIVFCHFDSIGIGASDNASGVAVCLSTILANKKILDSNLFVFDGNEEISYDYPVYWGKGYRNFERNNLSILKKAKKIIVVDCIGYSNPDVITDQKILNLALPLKNIKGYKNKMFLIASDYDTLMNVYHSGDDSVGRLKEKYLIMARTKLGELIG